MSLDLFSGLQARPAEDPADLEQPGLDWLKPLAPMPSFNSAALPPPPAGTEPSRNAAAAVAKVHSRRTAQQHKQQPSSTQQAGLSTGPSTKPKLSLLPRAQQQQQRNKSPAPCLPPAGSAYDDFPADSTEAASDHSQPASTAAAAAAGGGAGALRKPAAARKHTVDKQQPHLAAAALLPPLPLPLHRSGSAVDSRGLQLGGGGAAGGSGSFDVLSKQGEMELVMTEHEGADDWDGVDGCDAAAGGVSARGDAATSSRPVSGSAGSEQDGSYSGSGSDGEVDARPSSSSSGSGDDVASPSSGSVWSQCTNSNDGSDSGSQGTVGSGRDEPGGRKRKQTGSMSGAAASSRAAGKRVRFADSAAALGVGAGDGKQQGHSGLPHVEQQGRKSKGSGKAGAGRASSATTLELGPVLPGEVPLLLPSAHSLKRGGALLVELPAGFDAEGDAGAIGRVVCGTAAADADADAATAVARVGSRVLEAHALDLKGVMYNVQELMLAGTAAVVRINPAGKGPTGKPASANVEHVLGSFLRATPSAAAAEEECPTGWQFDDDECCWGADGGPEAGGGLAAGGGGGGAGKGGAGCKTTAARAGGARKKKAAGGAAKAAGGGRKLGVVGKKRAGVAKKKRASSSAAARKGGAKGGQGGGAVATKQKQQKQPQKKKEPWETESEDSE